MKIKTAKGFIELEDSICYDVFRAIQLEYRMEDAKAYAEEMGFGKISNKKAKKLAEMFLKYSDVNIAEWDTWQGVFERFNEI